MARVPEEARRIDADITGPQPGHPERPVDGRDWQPARDPARSGGSKAPGSDPDVPRLVGGVERGVAD